MPQSPQHLSSHHRVWLSVINVSEPYPAEGKQIGNMTYQQWNRADYAQRSSSKKESPDTGHGAGYFGNDQNFLLIRQCLEGLAARSRYEVPDLRGGDVWECLPNFVDGYVVEETAADGEEENHTEVLTDGHGTNGVGYLMNRNQRLHNGKTCDDVTPCTSSYEDTIAIDVGIGCNLIDGVCERRQ